MLTNVRTANLNSYNINMIRSRIIQPEDANYPEDALHIYAESTIAKLCNQPLLESIDNQVYFIKAIDNLPKNVPTKKSTKF